MTNRYADYTIDDLLEEAVKVQDACNLSGVVLSFADAIVRLRELFRDNPDTNLGTWDVNTHPISRLFAAKISELAGRVTDSDWKTAFNATFANREKRASELMPNPRFSK